MEAGLPGDQVKVSVLPLIKLEDNAVIPVSIWDMTCMAVNICYYAMAPLCALNVSVPSAVPIDSPELLKSVRFATCNQAKRLASHPCSGPDVTEEMRIAENSESSDCAEQVGIPYSEIKTCVENGAGTRLVHEKGYKDRVLKYTAVLTKSGTQMLPYIFLNGDVLRCDIDGAALNCYAIWTSVDGDQPLSSPGSLLHVVCSKLNPPPVACIGAGASSKRTQVGPTPACENCVAVGTFQWSHTAPSTNTLSMCILVAAAVALATLGSFGWKRANKKYRWAQADIDHQSPEERHRFLSE